MWIATDKSRDQWIFENKPERNGDVWISDKGNTCGLHTFPFRDNLPAFIQQQKWKDSPIQVKLEIKKK